MREIKFRAWDKTTKIMIKNYVESAANGELYVAQFQGSPDKPLPFLDLELMQYTGLKDKSGKEIYEGDIVKWGHAREYSREKPIRIAEVKIDPDIQFHAQVGIFKFGSFAYADTTEKDLEIIGNIYQNPELLKEQPC
jgi:uncharacterized phage protein (TIGR01671 family)